MISESGREFAQQVADHMEIERVPSSGIWFSCGDGKFEIGANVLGLAVLGYYYRGQLIMLGPL